MVSTSGGPEVGLCTGKDCRSAGGFRTVERELRRDCTVLPLPCLDVCDGVVVVLEPRSPKATVLERIGGKGLALEIVDHVVAGEPLSARLRKRRLSGTKQAKARRRVERAL
jgi:hypothetical protein